MLQKTLTLFAIGCVAAGCNGLTIVSPRPSLCTDWTLVRASDYAMLPDDSAVAQMVVEWNQTCAENHALVGLKWKPPVMQETARPWWRFWR